jgi:hypothetical protein
MTYKRLTHLERRVQRFRAWLDALSPDDNVMLLLFAGLMLWLLYVLG